MNKPELLDYNYAYSYCREIAVSHYENFPVGSLLVPKEKRKYIYSVYAFARYADDIADSNLDSSDDKIKKLNDLEIELNKIELNKTSSFIPETQNIFIALYDTIRILNIPVQEFRNLLIAFKQDAVISRYKNFDELISYSNYSANPIGHLVLYIFGYDSDKNKQVFEYSDFICTALQLTNFWQDVSEDLKINRIYIPNDLMAENNYDYEMLIDRTENENFIEIIKILIDKTKILFIKGKEILKHTSGRLRLELKATIAGGEEILNKIEETGYRVLTNKISISNFDKLKIIGNIILK